MHSAVLVDKSDAVLERTFAHVSAEANRRGNRSEAQSEIRSTSIATPAICNILTSNTYLEECH